MTMISFTHFDNFDQQPDAFKTGFEMDEGDFDSLLLSFAFSQKADDTPNKNFEFSQKEKGLNPKNNVNAEVISDDANKPNKTFHTFDQAFLPNDETAVPQVKSSTATELSKADFSAQKQAFQAEALADLESFVESKPLDSAENEVIKQTVSENADSEKTLGLEIGKEIFTKNEMKLPSAKQTDFSESAEIPQIVKEFTQEKSLDSKPPERVKLEPGAEVSKQKVETAKKPATEAEIEEIMVSKFSANETKSASMDENLSAEKIDLWQFKTPEFQDFEKLADADIPEAETVDFSSEQVSEELQDSEKIISETDVEKLESKPPEPKIKTETESASIQKTPPSKAVAAEFDSNAADPQAESSVEAPGNINPVDAPAYETDEIPKLPEVQIPKTEIESNIPKNQDDVFASIKEEIALKNSVDIINKSPKESKKFDLGENRITNLSQSTRSDIPVENKPLDLGERAANKISQPAPLPIHRQDLGEKAPNNLTNKFTKLIRKVSEAFDLSSKDLVELNLDQAEPSPDIEDLKPEVNVEPKIEGKIKEPQPKAPSPHNDKTQTPDIFINNTETDAPPREPMKLDRKTPQPIEANPPFRSPKSQIIPPTETINPEKASEIFRTSNVQMEGRNFALNAVEIQTEVDLQEYIEQIETPVLEQVENPVVEYLTSEQAFKKPEILKLRLHPAELGMVEVQFEKNEAGNIEIKFQAENEIAKQILADGFDLLHDRLQDNGLQIERLEISNSLLSSSGFEAGGENLPETESIENSRDSAETDDDLENEDDDPDRDEPERLVNLRA